MRVSGDGVEGGPVRRDAESPRTAVRRVESVAPVTTVAQLCAHIDTVADRLSAQLGEMESGLCGRLDSVNRQLRWIQACLLVVLAMMIAILLRI